MSTLSERARVAVIILGTKGANENIKYNALNTIRDVIERLELLDSPITYPSNNIPPHQQCSVGAECRVGDYWRQSRNDWRNVVLKCAQEREMVREAAEAHLNQLAFALPFEWDAIRNLGPTQHLEEVLRKVGPTNKSFLEVPR